MFCIVNDIDGYPEFRGQGCLASYTDFENTPGLNIVRTLDVG